MNETDFTIQKFNGEVKPTASNQLFGNDLNFGKALVQSFQEKLSVTAQYDPPEHYCALSGKLEPEDRSLTSGDDFYYGVSPLLDSRELIRCVSGQSISSEDELEEYIWLHHNFFMLHSGQEKYLLPLAKYIVVSMASHFGIRIRMDEKQYKALYEQLKNPSSKGQDDSSKEPLSQESLDTLFSYDKEDRILTVYGCLPAAVSKKLRESCYLPEEITKNKKKQRVWVPSDNNDAKSIDMIYQSGVELVKGRVFYSGVLLKPMEIEILERRNENNNICSVCFHFERSTFGTVCALDNNLTEHPLLKESKNLIVEFLNEDDNAKRKLSEAINNPKCTSSEQLIDAVNAYLSKSGNVNQIGISANVISSDGFLLLGLRNHETIDSGMIYPGVNGNAEVSDKNVSFYKTSVYEDCPSIRLDDHRTDFFGEIGREAYAEISQELPVQEWLCYGITLSGNVPAGECSGPTANYTEKSRRMHFNILMENTADKTFEEIEKDSCTSTEAFETNRLIGLKVRCEKNPVSYFFRMVGETVAKILTKKDVIEAFLAVAVFLTIVERFLKRPLSAENGLLTAVFRSYRQDNGTAGILSLLLSTVVVVYNVVLAIKALIKFCRVHNRNKRIVFFKSMDYSGIPRKLSKAFPKNKFHPAAYLSLLTYCSNEIYKSFFKKDNR